MKTLPPREKSAWGFSKSCSRTNLSKRTTNNNGSGESSRRKNLIYGGLHLQTDCPRYHLKGPNHRPRPYEKYPKNLGTDLKNQN